LHYLLIFYIGVPFFIMAKMDALSAKGCIAAFKAMGGVDVYIILPLPKYVRNGQLVACEKTAIFVGNIPARMGKRDGFASIFCCEDLEEELSDDEMETATLCADDIEA
jgi:hypothetical protein